MSEAAKSGANQKTWLRLGEQMQRRKASNIQTRHTMCQCYKAFFLRHTLERLFLKDFPSFFFFAFF